MRPKRDQGRKGRRLGCGGELGQASVSKKRGGLIKKRKTDNTRVLASELTGHENMVS